MSDVVGVAPAPVPPPSEPDIQRPWMVVIGSFVLLLLVAGLMYNAGLFDKPENEVEGNTLAAVLGLLGALLTELVVAAGLLLKHSFDLRTYQLALYEQHRLALEAERAHELKAHEQQRLDVEATRAEQHKQIEQERLRKDTVLKAVELLGDDSGQDASPARQVGALRALATLGELELALSLLDQLWSDPDTPKLPVAGALAIVDCVFEAPAVEGVDMRREAASILQFNAAKLFSPDDVMLPRVIRDDRWLQLPPRIALNLVLTVAKGSASVFPELPAVPSELVRYVVSYLVEFADTTKDERNRLIAAHTALELVRTIPRDDHVILRAETLSPDELEQRMRTNIEGKAVPLAGRRWVEVLRAWADGVGGGGTPARNTSARKQASTDRRQRAKKSATNPAS